MPSLLAGPVEILSRQAFYNFVANKYKCFSAAQPEPIHHKLWYALVPRLNETLKLSAKEEMQTDTMANIAPTCL